MPVYLRIALLLLPTLTYFASYPSYAQAPVFRAGLVAGINFAELEGEGITDYFGLNAGLISSFRFKERWQIGLEFLWSQNGEYILPDFYPPVRYGTIWLNHLEVPFHLDYLAHASKNKDYPEWHFSMGVAYTRLINFYIEDVQKNDRSGEVIYSRQDGIQLQWGTTYFITPQLGWNLRASLPIQSGLDWTIASRIVYYLI